MVLGVPLLKHFRVYMFFFCFFLAPLFLSFLVIMICHLELFPRLFILLVHYDTSILYSHVSQKYVINIFCLTKD